MTGKSSAITLVGTAYYKGFRMAVLHGSDDRFFAVRSDAPYFCFEGTSEQEVISAASEVIDAVLAEHLSKLEHSR